MLNISKANVIEIIKNSEKQLSLDAPTGPDEDSISSLMNVISNRNAINPEENLNSQSFSKELNQILNLLSSRERQVIEMYFGIDREYALPLEEVGLQLDLTRERVRQIREKALKRIRRATGVDSLLKYLK